MDDALDDFAEHVRAAPELACCAPRLANGELVLGTGRGDLLAVLRFLRDDSDSLFKMLADITAVDHPERAERFDVVYNLLSVAHNQRVRVTVAADERAPVPSAVPLFSSAGWFEREVWDMFGIRFDGHPDLRRMLTDYGFEGIPCARTSR